MGISLGGSCFGWGVHLAALISDGGPLGGSSFFLVGALLDQKIPSAITAEAPAPAINIPYTTPAIKPAATTAATATQTNYCILADKGAPRMGLY